MLQELAYLHHKPESKGLLRVNQSDFKVFELLPFLPCGEGEHLFIHIRKTGANTVFVARELAKYFKVKEQLVSYAGLKDRFAVTEQWFGIHVPGKQTYDLSDLVIEGVEVLSYKRHNKKLRTGALTGNRFELILRDVTELKTLYERWQKIIEQGVPNYFGEQRFGIDGGNIEHALGLFSGTKVKDKKKRGMYLSAARSYIFNAIVNQRIKNNTFSELQLGDVLMLAGSQSVFRPKEIDAVLKQRLIEKDVDITAAMWGAGDLMTAAEPGILEQEIADKNSEFANGLPRFGLKQERRRIRLVVDNADIELLTNDSLIEEALPAVKISFSLAAGSYATTVLRELIDYQDCTQRVNTQANGNIE
ncbi:tRNA pseudouridine(13) synthase TruD [Colwellia sp. 6_MG-2023]|jgi:tRNA pseudouridine13 synthase|uniref:tRNA pseudouridine(13) synthase TruD n=1 Tax=Colwellia sp. 6_MG-2023 TaxID=3062676 RepID=UPI0026E1E187|nr:tRNA pseudouridine(13) synthase TruD [Colwellia sp. 6_MG-2023]MDO6486617.1 tRNA pseudouridine(13) synthase TruD [Colwellia sp. 6_MG-2023]